MLDTYSPQHTATRQNGFSNFAMSRLDEVLVALHEAQLSEAQNHDAVVDAIEGSLKLRLSEGERGLLTDILLNLLRQAELDLRESLADRLGGMSEVPERMALAMAHDVISVARPVLENSPVLSADDLLYIIQSKTPSYWHAIARRKKLQAEIISQLAFKHDAETSTILIKNETVELPTSAIRCFAKLCRDNDDLAEPLLNRPEIDRSLAMELYWHVGQRLRTHISQHFRIDQKQVDAALQDSLQDMMASDKPQLDAPSPFKPSGLMVEVARNYQASGRINEQMLLQTLRRNQLKFFIALFGARTGMAHETVFQIMRQVGGQGMAVAAKANGISKETLMSLFLLSRSITRGEESVSAPELQKAIKYYDTLTEPVAKQIMAGSVTHLS